MTHHSSGRGGIFEGQLSNGSVRDVSLFPTVPTRGWPSGARHRVPTAVETQPIGFKNIGMGQEPSATIPQAIRPSGQSMPPQGAIVGNVTAYQYHNGLPVPAGYTAKGGILDGSTVESGQIGRGAFFEQGSGPSVGTGVVTRSVTDSYASKQNIPAQGTIMQPRVITGFGQATLTMGPRPLPVTVSFAKPRMLARSIFEGPVVRDSIPQANITPALKPMSGFGSGPDGLGSSSGCGCGAWKRR